MLILPAHSIQRCALLFVLYYLSLPAIPAFAAEPVQQPRGYTIPTLDLSGDSARQVIVDREPGQYLGHPTTVLLEDGRTMLCVYPKGHGRGAIVYKRSHDGGRTWSDRLPTPASWATSQEVPTLHRVVDAAGKKRLIMWSGLYPARLAVSEDEGETWSELQQVGDWGGIVVMGCVEALKRPGHYLAMFHDDGRYFRKPGLPSKPPFFTLYKTFSTDGGLTWSFPEAVYGNDQIHLCEPGCIRSPDGQTLAVLLRENARNRNSHIIFSTDEGQSWSEPRELPASLTGDRHTGKYFPDGRLFISFRDQTLESPTRGDWVAWVGTWQDLIDGNEGQYRVRLMDNHKSADCAYPGVELLPDGTIVTTTYGHWTPAEAPYIVSVRLRAEELDQLAKAQNSTSQIERTPVPVARGDWPWWRGPHRNGVADPDQNPPVSWSEESNVQWKAPVPGRGHGSATVIGDQVFLTAAEPDSQVQSVLCFDRTTGQQLWKKQIHQGNFPTKGNEKASLASTSVACDGERLYVNFLNGGAVTTTALDRQGEILWQTPISDYVIHQGYGSSPAIYGDLVIVSADNKGGGALAGLKRSTGEIVWKHTRPAVPIYSSPVIIYAAGKDQLIMTGCDLVSSYDPANGSKLWEIPGATTECVTSTTTNGNLIYTSGGYPRNHVAAVQADGSGKIAWESETRVYVPSMLFHEGHLYATLDAGVAICWDAATGAEKWKYRLGGTFSSSPVLAGDRIYATNEAGKTFVFRANPLKYEALGGGQLGQEVFSTPAICGGQIFLRVAHVDDSGRHEFLYCLRRME